MPLIDKNNVSPVQCLALLLSLLVLGILGCSKKTTSASAKSVESASKYRLFERSLEYSVNGNAHRYSLAIPQDYQSTAELPVIVYLHGRGGNENSELVFFSDYVDTIVEQCGIERPLIVFPSNENGLYLLDQGAHLASGLLGQVQQRFSLQSYDKRILAGFSIGGAAATRTAIIYPNQYAASVSWAGGLWPKDTILFDSVKNNAEELIRNKFTAHLFIGGKDSPELYNPLISAMEEHQLSYNRRLLVGQEHKLGQYLERTQEDFKSLMCKLLK